MDDVETLNLSERVDEGVRNPSVPPSPKVWAQQPNQPLNDKPAPNPKNTLAALFMQKRVKRFLIRKKFQCLTLSDIQEEVEVIEKLDDGFTDFFYFVIFLVAYFWMLSLQLSPNTGYHMSNSLMHVYEEPKFGPNLDKSFQDVASVDDVHSYLEALSLKIYQSSNHEYKCSDCSVTDSRMREKLGEGYLSILSSCAFSDPPSCPFEIDPECLNCLNQDFSEFQASTTEFKPETTFSDINTIRDEVKIRCSLDWMDMAKLRDEGGVTERFADVMLNYKTNIPAQPNFSSDFIVDCHGRKYNRRTCRSIVTGEEEDGSDVAIGYEKDCMDAVEHLMCISPATPSGTFRLLNDDSALSYSFDFSCGFFDNIKEEMCAAVAVPDPSNQPIDDDSDDQCLPGYVLDCLASEYANCEPSSSLGDGTCDPNLNCRKHGFDGGDCMDWTPPSTVDSNGNALFCNCNGYCEDIGGCQSYGASSCDDVNIFFGTNGECDIIKDCPAFSFDNGECGDFSTYNGVKASNSTANNLWHEQVYMNYLKLLDPSTPTIEESRPARTFEDEISDLQGGWIGEHRSIGGTIFVAYFLSERGQCDKSDQAHDAVFPSCKGDKVFGSPLDIEGKYMLEYYEEIGAHVDLIDTGAWNVGLKQTFCSVEKNRLFFNNPFSNLRVDKISIMLPVYNGNVDGGTYAIGELTFEFLTYGDVDMKIESQSYKLEGEGFGLRKLVDWLELICFLLAVELFIRAIRDIRKDGIHVRNAVTILASFIYVFIALLWGSIKWFGTQFDIAELQDTDPLTGDDGFTNLVVDMVDFIYMKELYAFYAFINVGFSILGLLRVFLILSFHKRLSILTETLWTGLIDIYHWMVVLMMFTTVFATVFHYMLGAHSEKFSTFWGSFKELLLLVVGFEAMTELELTNLGWFLCILYGVVVTILMINLSLGIVLDAYNIHTSEREDSDTLPHSLKVFFYRVTKKKVGWIYRIIFPKKQQVYAAEETLHRAMERRKTGEAMKNYRKMSAALNVRQMHALPISIKQAKEVLRDEYLSEEMIRVVLKKVVVKKLCSGGLVVKEKKG
eukprot:CAMPEP_0118639486 /NCGR_PEP_ID=MMETSP0785-20121206/4247_1 /TAXON_ID=91992 /ORGANISM="Bolidomonas pacifica, Strain CCMP 1866" /LENGTH=1063 /DNA_ID=CAMNT_0006530813 /DNA_START=111 /DNA_END=3298 /DNA_ORIENTATION=-